MTSQAQALFADALAQLSRRVSLEREVADQVMTLMMAGELGDIEMAALLTALAVKGESVDEIAGAAAAMRRAVTRIDTDAVHPEVPAGIEGRERVGASRSPVVIDVCGTGGTGFSRRNVSTAVALVLASRGIRVAKHGNRAASSRSGSADVLEALGVVLDPAPSVLRACLDEVGVAFLFARSLHPAVAHASRVRSTLKIRTLFNLLGPMCNPAAVLRQSIGLYDPSRCLDVARAMLETGSERVFVMHGFLEDEVDAQLGPAVMSSPRYAPDSPRLDAWVAKHIQGRKSGLDDLSLSGPTLVVEAHRHQTEPTAPHERASGELQVHLVRPEAAGIQRHPIDALLTEAGAAAPGEQASLADAPQRNAEAMLRLLGGRQDGAGDRAYRDAVIYAAAVGALVAGDIPLDEPHALTLHANLARAALDDGSARATLNALVRATAPRDVQQLEEAL